MNVIKKNFYHILFFVVGVVLIAYAFKLYAFGVDYETNVTHSVMLVDTASTTTKVKQNIHYNTTGYFIENSTGKKFQAPIQDKLYRKFEAGGDKPIAMEKNLSQSEINQSGRGFLAFIFSVIFVLVGSISVLCVAHSKFKEYKLKIQYFFKYGNQNE